MIAIRACVFSSSVRFLTLSLPVAISASCWTRISERRTPYFRSGSDSPTRPERSASSAEATSVL